YSQPRIITSRIIPSIYYNTKNAQLDPTMGKSFLLGLAVSGGPLGGDVNTFQPQLDFQWFKPVLRRRSEKPHVLAMRFKADHIRAFGAPPPVAQGNTRSLSFLNNIPIFERFFLGGEYDIRGYNLRSITPVVLSDVYQSTRGTPRPQIVDADGNRVDYTGPLDASVLRQFMFDAPEGNCAGLNAPDIPGRNCNVVRTSAFLTPLGGDTQLIYNIEYRIPIISVLSLAAFADVGTVFNARKYTDQITSSNFVNQQIFPAGLPFDPNNPGNNPVVNPFDGSVIIDSATGLLATNDQVNTAIEANGGTLPDTFKSVFFQGESQSFQVVRASQSKWRIPEDIRSSLGLEFRVQMPVINVPFRLIFAYNPRVEDPDNV
ncbi:MAG: outer membrane protein assembly factor, partial [Planctomycetia bacterium]|nr:outer membrane protein assembly factor [Planctomycetia bacterium]